MSATVSIKQVVGASPTPTSIENLRFNTDDTVNPGSTNPLVKPAAGINRSYWKTIYLNADTTPEGVINNVKIFFDGVINWTGCNLYLGSSGNYTQATGMLGVTGDDSSIATANANDFSQATPKRLTGNIANPATGRVSDYVVMQVDIGTSAVAGSLTVETGVFQYDET